MASQALRSILRACERLEAAYAQPAPADEAQAGRQLAESQRNGAAELNQALEAFRAETGALEPGEVDALLAALVPLRAKAAAVSEFSGLRIKLAETLQRLAQPPAPQNTYDARGGKQAAPPAAPPRLDKSF
jgi:hypothetical protein